MISHVKIVILTHIVEIRRLKVKYIVDLWIKDTSIQGTNSCAPLCPLKRGSTVSKNIMLKLVLTKPRDFKIAIKFSMHN